MKVIAIDRGYDGLCVREADEEFDVADDFFEKNPDPVWFEPKDIALKAKVARKSSPAPAVPAVNPGKQADAQRAQNTALAEAQETERRETPASGPKTLKL